ncbi:response regulator [Sporomusa sphaeroides]|uniref:DNA-binding response regulator MtrA n=1 Tax=Sporomusa sphaeroides DSM 2875 TaxID=1337886 RepID=A0ABM9W6D2_9FIRM|nr:response regulator [Sporomusa sphaeroides]OLS54382.1 chemotaxis protein CheY [Sporomusa sphaeroides DSM 2875]CVK20625.1 DNA-binding response regulator MtrA [Sporomusa sphaeroides DSM 2875]
MRFVIIEDDPSVRKIMSNIIEKYKLGTVVAECGDGLQAESIITEYAPDVALVDLLLPGQDGVELIRKLKETKIETSWIMISESTSQPMITKAYQTGIDFYIHKPINVLEIVSVIGKVEESRRLRQVMSLISQTTARYVGPGGRAVAPDDNTKKNRLNRVFSDLGIIGEAGVKNIHQLAQLVNLRLADGHSQSYQLHELYQELSQEIGQDVKTIEQRVRRAIAKAMQNVANMGIEDYHNDKFEMYSGALFDFKEIRQEMAFIQGKGSYRGKINIKKFLEGLLFLAAE